MKPLSLWGKARRILAQENKTKFQVQSGELESAARHKKMCRFSRYNNHIREYHGSTHLTLTITFTIRTVAHFPTDKLACGYKLG